MRAALAIPRLCCCGSSTRIPDIASALVRNDYDEVIRGVREAVTADGVAALSDAVIQEWLGRRYRNIFLTECGDDASALRAAKVPMPIQLIDRRSSRELVAARFLKGVNRQESQALLPDAKEPKLNGSTLLFVPGLMTGLLPVMAFQSVWGRIEKRFGVRIWEPRYTRSARAPTTQPTSNWQLKRVAASMPTLNTSPPKKRRSQKMS